MNWIGYSIIAILLVGVSDIFRKLGSQLKDPFFSNMVFQVASATTAIILFLLFSRKIENNPQYIIPALIGGALISTFTLFSFKALSIGPGVSTVMPVLRIGGIMLVVVLGVFLLKEQFTLVKAAGLLLSCIGLYLLFSK